MKKSDLHRCSVPKVGDWVRDCDPRSQYRSDGKVVAVGPTHATVTWGYRGTTVIKLSRIHARADAKSGVRLLDWTGYDRPPKENR